MALAAYNRVVQNGSGTVQENALISVTNQETLLPAEVWSDREGTISLGSSFTTLTGEIKFYAPPGRYKIVATKSGFSATYTDELIGTTADGGVSTEKLASSAVTRDKVNEDIVTQVADRPELKALASPVAGQAVEVVGTGRAGIFVWTLGDFTAEAAADTNEGIYVKADSTAVSVGMWVRTITNNVTTSRHWGCEDVGLTSVGRKAVIEQMWAWCVANGVDALMMPDTLVVERNGSGNALDVPSNLTVCFVPGCKITKEDYDEGTVETFYRLVSLTDASNVTMSGVLELDGRGDTVTWFNEHNHNIFFFNTTDVNADNLKIVSYNSMGDCVSLSGSGNSGGNPSERVRIGAIDCTNLNADGKTARRKSLVIESCIDCWIGHAVLDNGVNGCLDYEPLSLSDSGDITSCRVDYIKCYSPVDFTAGTSYDRLRIAKLSFGGFFIEIPSGRATTGELLLSYAVHCDVERMVIDYSTAANSCRPMLLQYSARWNIRDLTIHTSDTVAGTPLSLRTSSGFTPTLEVGTLRLYGKGNKAIDQRGRLLADKIYVEGVTEDVAGTITKTDFTNFKIGGQQSASGNDQFTHVNALICRDVVASKGLVSEFTVFSGNAPSTIYFGHISYTDTTTDGAPINALFHSEEATISEYVTIGGFTATGQEPSKIVASGGSGLAFCATSGGFGAASTYIGTVAVTSVPAKAGSTYRKYDTGQFYFKTTDDDGMGDRTSGWLQVQVA